MTKQEQIERLCYKYPALAAMNAENLARRIRLAELGKSDPAKLAAKLLEIKAGAKVSADAPEDEQIWAAVLLKQLPARAAVVAPEPEPVASKKPAEGKVKSDDK